MAKKQKDWSHEAELSHKEYEAALYTLQVELVKLQSHIIKCDDRILVIFEGRDAAGKDGAIKRIIEHLSPREVRVVALGKPSNREITYWYFQRYVSHLPAAQEMVLFNRSWYNRAGVERVMGFCTKEQVEAFMEDVPQFEGLLIRSGIKLLKFYLDITKSEQRERLDARKDDPLTQWKVSSIDQKAVKLWKDYSDARNEMLVRTHTTSSPWYVVRADDKRRARLNVIRMMLSKLDYAGKRNHHILPDPSVVFPFSKAAANSGHIAP